MTRVSDDQSKKWMQVRLAKTALGGSTYRAMPRDSDEKVQTYLSDLKLDRFKEARNGGMDELLEQSFGVLHQRLSTLPARVDKRGRVRELGDPWGYAAKAVNIFLYNVTLNRILTEEDESKAILPLLHCPIDAKIFAYLRKNTKANLRSRRLNGINSETYEAVQKAIKAHASDLNIPPVRIDDLSWTVETKAQPPAKE